MVVLFLTSSGIDFLLSVTRAESFTAVKQPFSDSSWAC